MRSNDDVEGFVRARFPALARTAYLVCTDPDQATRLAVATLADATAGGASRLAEGTPAADAWRGLVTRLVAADPSASADLPGAGPDEVPAALWRTYAGLPVLARVALAAEHVEGTTAAETAVAAGRPLHDVTDELATARAILAEAHDRARDAVDLGPAPDALEADLGEALRRRADGAALPLDAAPLLGLERRGRRRRAWARALAGATVAASAIAAMVVLGRPGEPLPPPGSPTATTTPSPSPSGVPLTEWPDRGGLAADAATVAAAEQVMGPDAHLLYADEVGAVRVVLGWGSSTTPGAVRLVALSAPAGTSAMSLVSVTEVPDGRAGIAVRVPSDGTSAGTETGPTTVVVLGPPGQSTAEISATVAIGLRGGPERTWQTVELHDGVGFVSLPAGGLPALRVRVADYDGPPTNADEPPFGLVPPPCADCALERWAAAAVADTVARLAAATGLPESSFEASQVVTGRFRASDLATAIGRPRTTAADMACTAYRLPSGRVLSSTHVRTLADGRYEWYGGHLDLHPAGTATDQPCLELVHVSAGGTRTYLVAAPGATAMQLVATGSRRFEWPELTPTPTRIGLLRVPPTPPGEALVLHIEQPDAMTRTSSVEDGMSWVDPFDLEPAGT